MANPKRWNDFQSTQHAHMLTGGGATSEDNREFTQLTLEYEDVDNHEHLALPDCAPDPLALPPAGSDHHMHTRVTPVESNYEDALYMITTSPPASLLSWLSSMLVSLLHPNTAHPGSIVLVHLQVCIPTSTYPPLWFYIAFANKHSPCSLKATWRSDQYLGFELSTIVPAPPLGLRVGQLVPELFIEDEAGNRLMSKPIGDFQYADATALPRQILPVDYKGKRKASFDSQLLAITPEKRLKWSYLPPNQARPSSARDIPSPPLSQRAGSPESKDSLIRQEKLWRAIYEGTYATANHNGMCPGRLEEDRLTGFMQTMPLTRSLSANDGRLPATPSLSSPTTNSHYIGVRPATRLATNPVPLSIFQTPSVRMDPASAQAASNQERLRPSNESQSLYTPKTKLQLNGDLDSVMHRWTHEEKVAQRRIVVFERTQTGNVITTSFNPVSLEEHVPGSVCVSCIWWDSRGASYVTSVDAIALAESLCGYKFNVPVKNRIRRNMEGYKPVTVAKDKAESEDFFKLIMGFTNPKPRNIEKHIKVFPWTCLKGALQKIVGKYARQSPAKTANWAPQRQAAIQSTTAYGSGSSTSGPRSGLLNTVLTQPFSPTLGGSSYDPSLTQTSSGKSMSRATTSPNLQSSARSRAPSDYAQYKPYHFGLDHNSPSLVAPLPPYDYGYWQQPQELDDSIFRGNDVPDFSGWGLPSLVDPGLTATPATLQYSHQHLGLAGSGTPVEFQTPLQQHAQTPDLRPLCRQYMEDPPIHGRRS